MWPLNARVLVEGLKRAGKNLTRENLIAAIESIRDFDMGFGPDLKINYSPTFHKGFVSVYYTVVQKQQVADLNDWKRFRR